MDKKHEWKLVALCGLVITLLAAFSTGCTTTISLKTHAQEWETRKGRFVLNGAIKEATVKSLEVYREEYKEVQTENKLAKRHF